MNSIRKKRNKYAFSSLVSIFFALWLGSEFKLGAFIFGFISAIYLLLLVRQVRLLYDARLIWDNRILAVPYASISMSGQQTNKDIKETVVSTFGILMDCEIYRWGLQGLHGVRLHAVRIDRERMYLTFGDRSQTMRVELLHHMTDKHTIVEAAEKIFYETGVITDIMDW